MSLSKILYRDLLTAAKQFDRHASLRALLSSNLLQRPLIHETRTRLPHVENFNRFVLEFLENRSFYVPSPEKKALVQLVRDNFRAVDSESGRAPAAIERVLVDTAFVALKALNDKLAEAKELGVIGDKPVKKLRYAARAGKRDEPAETPMSIANVQHAESVLMLRVYHKRWLASGFLLVRMQLCVGTWRRASSWCRTHCSAACSAAR